MYFFSLLKLKFLKIVSLCRPNPIISHRRLRRLQIDIANQSFQLKKNIDKFFRISLPEHELRLYNELITHSQSQCRQDVIIALICDRNPGLIVEVGATDGILLSNSLMLEQILDWECVLVEPCRAWKQKLILNRSDSKLVFDAVSHSSNLTLNFTETEYPELSGISVCLPDDFWSAERRNCVTYDVNSTTLDSICNEYSIDGRFLVVTIDIEGGEVDALRGFTENIMLANLLVIENNGSLNKIDSLDKILLNLNFVRLIWPFDSFDSWYLREDYLTGCSILTYLLQNSALKTIPSICY